MANVDLQVSVILSQFSLFSGAGVLSLGTGIFRRRAGRLAGRVSQSHTYRYTHMGTHTCKRVTKVVRCRTPGYSSMLYKVCACI